MKKINLIATVLIGTVFSITPNARAATWYWDTTWADPALGNGVGGPGTLTTTSTNWSSVSTGSASGTTGTWTTTGAMGTADTMAFQGTAGAVIVGGSTSSQAIQVNSTGYTFTNNSPTSNRYLGATNGITLGNGVNLNLSGGVAAASANGILGLRMSGIQAAAGASGTSITITGDNGSVAGSGVRIGFTTNGIYGSGTTGATPNPNNTGATNIIAVNTIVATTGAQSTYFHISDSYTAARFEGTLTINSGSKLVLSPGASTTRTIDVRGNITTFANGALSIGEAANTGKVF